MERKFTMKNSKLRGLIDDWYDNDRGSSGEDLNRNELCHQIKELMRECVGEKKDERDFAGHCSPCIPDPKDCCAVACNKMIDLMNKNIEEL